jgi:hypothetical protein
MKPRFILFRRGSVFYAEETATGKQTSLRTKDESEAVTLLNVKNEATRQPASPDPRQRSSTSGLMSARAGCYAAAPFPQCWKGN